MKSNFIKYWLPVLGWMLLIFSASTDMMSAEHTSRFFVPFLHWLIPGISSVGVALSQFFIRKAAHVTEYAILAALLWRAVRDRNSQGRKFFWPQAGIVLLSATAYAGLDEFHQTFVFSRTGSIYDVMIDGCGAFLALLICWFFVRGRAARELDTLELSADSKAPFAPHHLARITLLAFLLTFIAMRVVTILLMAHRFPLRLQHLGPIYLHHLHSGVVLLAGIAGVLLYNSLGEKQRRICALLFGIGVAMVFDDFGVWVHLGKSYWQRAGFDALVVLLGTLAVIAFAPAWKRMRSPLWGTAMLTALIVIVFYGVLLKSVAHAGMKSAQRLIDLEQQVGWTQPR